MKFDEYFIFQRYKQFKQKKHREQSKVGLEQKANRAFDRRAAVCDSVFWNVL